MLEGGHRTLRGDREVPQVGWARRFRARRRHAVQRRHGLLRVRRVRKLLQGIRQLRQGKREDPRREQRDVPPDASSDGRRLGRELEARAGPAVLRQGHTGHEAQSLHGTEDDGQRPHEQGKGQVEEGRAPGGEAVRGGIVAGEAGRARVQPRSPVSRVRLPERRLCGERRPGGGEASPRRGHSAHEAIEGGCRHGGGRDGRRRRYPPVQGQPSSS
mmetsp:Transcript_39930/g.73697  ORF Transcript_39930/g.73697 Transcript_39930/m.73697 type:complete len:215 (+) Transcript_39930:1402-2046(+)